jgi:hypothetical protein
MSPHLSVRPASASHGSLPWTNVVVMGTKGTGRPTA